MKRNNKLNKLSNKEIFELMSLGSIDRLPNNFWDKETIIEATKWIIEEELQWTEEDIKNKLATNVLRKYRVLDHIYTYYNSIYYLINDIYPNRFKPWEFNQVPNNFWNKNTLKEFAIWMIEEKLQWSDEEIKNKLTSKIFRRCELEKYIYMYYNSIYDLINDIYPNRFKPWELKNTPNNFWNKNTLKEFAIWMIEEKYKWSDDDIKNNLSSNIFKEYKINIDYFYKYFDSLYDLINEIYPNRFKPWEFKKVSPSFWTKETIIEATKWMIEEKLQWNEEDIKNNLTLNIFKKYITTDINQIYIHFSNLYDLINEIYPNRFKPWEMKRVSADFWTKERVIEATKWMIEEKLKWTEKDIKDKLNICVFKKYRINIDYFYKYFDSLYDLINEIYPNRFHRDDFDRRLKKNRINKG